MHARRPEFRDLIERSLQRELTARRELRPHAQLAIQPNAPRAAVEEAYQRLRARYDANAFAEYGDVAVAATQGIAELIRVAHEAMLQPPPVEGGEPKVLVKLEPKPRGDETCRALETLRGAIERRIGEAQAHRAAGRLQDALRVLESVLVLDRQNKLAQDGVRELRIALEPPKKPTTWSRVFGRLFRRRQPVEAVVRVGGG